MAAEQQQLNAQLRRLSHASAVFRRQAAVGVFQLLSAGAARGSADATLDTVQQCLTDRHAEVVDESVAQLLQLIAAKSGKQLPHLDADAALQALLSALTSATARTAPLLARGVAAAFLQRQQQQHAGSANNEVWSRHPLSAALLAHPASAQQLLACACAELEPGHINSSSSKLTDMWQWLAPFFTFILLRPIGCDTAGSSSSTAAAAASGASAAAAGDRLEPLTALALRTNLVGALVRISCSSVHVARLVVPFLLSRLICMGLGDDAAIRCAGWREGGLWLTMLGVMGLEERKEKQCVAASTVKTITHSPTASLLQRQPAVSAAAGVVCGRRG